MCEVAKHWDAAGSGEVDLDQHLLDSCLLVSGCRVHHFDEAANRNMVFAARTIRGHDVVDVDVFFGEEGFEPLGEGHVRNSGFDVLIISERALESTKK